MTAISSTIRDAVLKYVSPSLHSLFRRELSGADPFFILQKIMAINQLSKEATAHSVSLHEALVDLFCLYARILNSRPRYQIYQKVLLLAFLEFIMDEVYALQRDPHLIPKTYIWGSNVWYMEWTAVPNPSEAVGRLGRFTFDMKLNLYAGWVRVI